MSSPTLFTRIIRGEIPCEKILEDKRFFAFLDIRPINPGHTLVVPKFETDHLFDLEIADLAEALPFAQKIAKALKKSIDCERIGIMVAGFEIPHAHIHLVPISSEGELSFSHAKAADKKDLALIAEKIRGNL